MIKICCITYKYLDDLVREAIDRINDPELELSVVEGLRSDILDDVQKEISDGAEVLLAGGANAKIAERHFHVPVLNYKISDFDYLPAIHKGYELGRNVAIVTYQTGISSKLRLYLESQNLFIENVIYEDSDGLERSIRKLDAEVVIGASHAVEIGRKCGKETVLIYPGVESVVETILDGKLMAQEINKVKKQGQFATTILRYTTNGVLLIDAGQKIIDSNLAMEKILKRDKRSLNGKQIDTIIEQWCDNAFLGENIQEKNFIIDIDGQEILEKVIKIGTNPQKFEGAVLIFLKLNELKKAQLEHARKDREESQLKGFAAKKTFADIIGSSYKVKSCIEDAKVFARSDVSVMIYGETGVGKELFAQGIHNASQRAQGPFIAINCGALTETLLEAELFGYDDGAFTGSRKGGKKGLFEQAEGGTIFLDEIGEISSLMQTKLLRVLQEREIMRVGGERIISVDVRIISATNRRLEEMEHELFRKDLLYRLNVLELHIPPLREREKDVEVLFEAFYLQQAGHQLSRAGLSKEVRELTGLYFWPGNIRELQNVCIRYCLYLEQTVKMKKEIPIRCMIKAIGEDKVLQSILEKYQNDEKAINRELVLILKNTLSYSREKIAQLLGTSRTTIWRVLKEESENVSKKGANQAVETKYKR